MNVSICSNIEIHQQELSREAIRRSTEHRTFFYRLCPEDTIVILRSFLLDSRVMFFHCFDLFSLQKQFDILRPLYPNMINVDSFS